MTIKAILPGILLLSVLCLKVFAQIEEDEQQQIQQELLNESNVLEDFLSESEEGEFDNNTVYEYLEEFLRHPIDLNNAAFETFKELNLLSDIEINAILDYREKYGPFISVSELQAVPLLPIASARRIAPFVKIRGGEGQMQTGIMDMISEGKNEMFMRWSRTAPLREGFRIQDTTRSRFLGDPNQYYLRFRHSFERNLSYGFTAEKDPGEEFFTGSNKQGFDFYSGHFYLRDYKPWLRGLAVGDYIVNLGQGLIHYHGFATGKSSFTTAIKRSGRRLRGFTSVNEADFLRGGAVDIQLFDLVDVLLFASARNIDANTVSNVNDTLMVDEEEALFTSFQRSGLHRTKAEIEDKNSTQKLTYGSSIGVSNRKFSIHFNAVYNQLSKSAVPGNQLYQQFNFSGDELLNIGLDYSYIYRNFHFFGETALSDNGALATVNGLMLSLDRVLDLSLQYRNMPRDYHSLAPFPFAETRNGQNEKGWYLGFEYRPDYNWRINGYLDRWEHPWLRFGVDAPSMGSEQFLRITYYKKRRYEWYFQLRNELKEVNYPAAIETEAFDVLGAQRRTQLRLHLNNKISKSLELRNRAEFSYYDIDGQAISRGFLLYQDIIFRPVSFPISFTARYALFDTDDYNSRIYAYESDLLYVFTIPPYFNQGSRYYLNVRYRPQKWITLEFRYARTNYNDIESISSGLNEIPGNKRDDFRAQVKFQF
ncbi:MAG TPA: helix-hairpin-helix domain-containing protein [Saprospiraceae bacterium]|nr:helix-hairpin-helix domain-containing protein [Saprospiraceae bacterium]